MPIILAQWEIYISEIPDRKQSFSSKEFVKFLAKTMNKYYS